MKVFRIHKKRQPLSGFYHTIEMAGCDSSNIGWWDDFVLFNNDRTRHPSPEDDSLIPVSIKSSDYFYGFTSPEQLFFWFYKEEFAAICEKYNLIISVFEVPEEKCVVGHTQVLIDKEYFTDYNESVESYTVEQFKAFAVLKGCSRR